jgi:hypothetical protein
MKKRQFLTGIKWGYFLPVLWGLSPWLSAKNGHSGLMRSVRIYQCFLPIFENMLKPFFPFMLFCCVACHSAKPKLLPQNPTNIVAILDSLLQANPQHFKAILDQKEAFKVQIIYTQINRDAQQVPHFTQSTFNLNADAYFYPASTVKMPMALLALEKINGLAKYGVTKNSLLITDTTSPQKGLSVADYVKEIFLVSDNDAFNRLYDFVGQASANAGLYQRGYKQSEILHRLSVAMTAEQNRNTPAVKFLSADGQLLYQQPAAYNAEKYQQRKETIGKGYYAGNNLVMQPMDFSGKNKMPLADLQQLLQTVLFPESVPADKRFNLTADDYNLLYRYMSCYPSESGMAKYKHPNYWDAYVKFLYHGSEKGELPKNIRIFNKVGNAYGQLTDVAYIVDFEHNIEFMLAATIYCNSDGILNDDKYDYDNIGFPFLKHLGKVVYDYEKQRPKQIIPDLSRFKIDYKRP